MSSPRQVQELVARADESLLNLVDHILNKGVNLTGDIVLSIADVDLVYIRLAALVCAADRLWPPADEKAPATAGRRRRPRRTRKKAGR